MGIEDIRKRINRDMPAGSIEGVIIKGLVDSVSRELARQEELIMSFAPKKVVVGSKLVKGPDTLEEGLAQTEFFVEATRFEEHCLWKDHHKEVEWGQCSLGWSETIGNVGKRPVCVSCSFAILNGHTICFYYGSSQVVDHRLVEEWLDSLPDQPTYDEGRRRARTNGMNFGHCLNYVKK